MMTSSVKLNDVLTGTMAKGFEYMYAYMNKDGKLSFECADSLGVVEVREKDTDDGCAYVIYWYVDKLTKENKVIKRIQCGMKIRQHSMCRKKKES